MIQYKDIDMNLVITAQKLHAYSSESFYTEDIIAALEDNARIVAEFAHSLYKCNVTIFPRYLMFAPINKNRYLDGLDITTHDSRLEFFNFWDLKENRVIVSSPRGPKDKLYSLLNLPH